MLQFDNEYKLYNLLEELDRQKNKLYNLGEALSLDDYADEEPTVEEEPNEKPGNNAYLSDIVQVNPLVDFANLKIFRNDESELTPMEKMLIKNVNNDTNDTYTRTIFVKDLEQLKTALRNGVKYFGMDGNFNWIDTSNITVMVNLFKSALGKGVEQFNGDISKWDVSNVENMMYIFKDCSSLTCDISNWDVSHVRFWSSASFQGTPTVFSNICKHMHFPLNAIRKR